MICWGEHELIAPVPVLKQTVGGVGDFMVANSLSTQATHPFAKQFPGPNIGAFKHSDLPACTN